MLRFCCKREAVGGPPETFQPFFVLGLYFSSSRPVNRMASEFALRLYRYPTGWAVPLAVQVRHPTVSTRFGMSIILNDSRERRAHDEPNLLLRLRRAKTFPSISLPSLHSLLPSDAAYRRYASEFLRTLRSMRLLRCAGHKPASLSQADLGTVHRRSVSRLGQSLRCAVLLCPAGGGDG